MEKQTENIATQPKMDGVDDKSLSRKEKRRVSNDSPKVRSMEGVEDQSLSGKEKRRVSNDSPKARLSAKVAAIMDELETGKNGHTKDAHAEGNGVEKKEVTPKNNKKEKGSTADKTNEKEKKVDATPEKKEKFTQVHGEKTTQEMEKLVLEPDTQADSPMPKSIGKNSGRILKYTPGKGRISPFKTATERLQNASTIVNLSTVSEQSTESTSAAASPAVQYDTPVKPPIGRVSGRRNTRPIKEIKLLHPTSANDSASSIKANLGSPVHNDSLRTPIISQLIGRKRAGTPEHIDIHVDSPSKRARIDFSGFLGYVTTPVSLLKNRLSRIGLTASTPRTLDVEEKIADVSGMEDSQTMEDMESANDKEIEDIKAENEDKSMEKAAEPPTPTRRRSVCNIM